MAEDGPSKADINAVFKKLRSFTANKICFDCGAKNPTWSSVTYGVFICIDCSAIHRGLGVHVSFVRSTQLDTNWTWLQLRAMQCGGNISATQFFRQHGCSTTDAQQKYKSRAAQLYREKLHHAAVATQRLHGTKVHIDSSDQLSPSGQGPEGEDFFEEHSNENNIPKNASEISMSDDMYMTGAQVDTNEEGPSVEGLDENKGRSSPLNPEGKKTGSAIGKRPQNKKVGAKKGLGAQKVNAKFSDIEQKAEFLDKEREEAAKLRLAESLKPKEPDPEITKLSSRLMVQDINKERLKEEEKLKKQSDPTKVEQFERLGMGFGGGKGGVAHSIASDIKTIQQDGVRQKRENRRKEPDFDDDWEILNREPSSRRSGFDDYNNGGRSRGGNDEEEDFFKTFDIASKPSQPDLGTWTSNDDGNSPRDRNKASTTTGATSDDAQKKFGNAKAISSDQYFGDRGTDFETRSNLSRFEGASAIGSADLFGGASGGGSTDAAGGRGYASHMPDMTDIKDSVKHGVTKVGSKLSNLSSSVQSYISAGHATGQPNYE